MQHKDGDYFYPLTTIDQVIMEDGLTRLSGADLVSVSTDGAPEGEVVGINADTLGGYAADAYVKKTDAMVVTKNYSVVGGMDEPTIPTENMIWIQTENNTIGKVHFSGVEPNNINDNDILIYTGNSSGVAFDAIKIGNDTMNTVYPISAKQYVSGAWVDKTAKSYQGGKWVDWWNGELYVNGNQYDSITGGWKRDGYAHSLSSMAFSAGTHSNGKMVLSGALKLLGTQKAVDATKYNKLTISGKIVAAGSECLTVMVATQKSPFNSNNIGSVSVNTTGEFSKDIPLSGVNVPVYIVCYTQNSSTNNAEITSVKLS